MRLLLPTKKPNSLGLLSLFPPSTRELQVFPRDSLRARKKRLPPLFFPTHVSIQLRATFAVGELCYLNIPQRSSPRFRRLMVMLEGALVPPARTQESRRVLHVQASADDKNRSPVQNSGHFFPSRRQGAPHHRLPVNHFWSDRSRLVTFGLFSGSPSRPLFI